MSHDAILVVVVIIGAFAVVMWAILREHKDSKDRDYSDE